jgi:hypothetical protein
MAKEILPPSISPAGILLMALIRSPAQAQMTRGLIEIGVPSLRTLPRNSFAKTVHIKKVITCLFSKIMKQQTKKNP